MCNNQKNVKIVKGKCNLRLEKSPQKGKEKKKLGYKRRENRNSQWIQYLKNIRSPVLTMGKTFPKSRYSRMWRVEIQILDARIIFLKVRKIISLFCSQFIKSRLAVYVSVVIQTWQKKRIKIIFLSAEPISGRNIYIKVKI